VRDKLSIAGIVVLVLLDLALVTVAFRSVGSSDASPRAADLLSSDSSSDAATPSPSTTVDKGPLVFMSLLADGTLVRASRGDCQGNAVPAVRVSAHAGRGSMARVVPGLGQVLATQAVPPRTLTIVGLDHSCQLMRFSSANLGRSWTREQGDGGAWHALADRTVKSVHGPGVVRSAPCADGRLPQPQAGVVRLLCPDGSIYGTDDDGQSWPYEGRLSGAVDIVFTSPGSGFAVARQPGCAAAVLRTIDSGTTWSQTVCLPGRAPRAVAAAGSLVAAQVGDKLSVSRDGGASWPKPLG
jgi:hypothetical protein